MDKIGMRVQVFNGTGKKDLGLGTYLGEVSVWVVEMPDGSLRTNSNAEERPTDIPPGGVLRQIPRNPKIQLDSGKIVYGSQVWWEPEPKYHPFVSHKSGG
jgi:hypothetical protein